MEFLIMVDIFFQYFFSNWKFTIKVNFKIRSCLVWLAFMAHQPLMII